MATTDKINIALTRGVSEVIVESELNTLLSTQTKLRLKMGFDPSAPDIHLGHVVGLRKLREFQQLGHTVVLIVGDWTAQIGDPSGRSSVRKMLSASQVEENAATYLKQFFKIVDKEKTEVRWQSEWFGDFDLANVIKLTSMFTVAQFLARDDFSKRFKEQKPIAITEFMYPLLQAYDSVAINSDVEFGGTDQKFNLLVGRDMQEMMDQKPQHCLLVPILVGTDGVNKMSKSLNNSIDVSESPNNMFGQLMSINDDLIYPYFELLTDISEKELKQVKAAISDTDVNPMDLKKNLASKIVAYMHSEKDADNAAIHFKNTVQSKEVPVDIPEFRLSDRTTLEGQRLSSLIVECGLSKSGGEAKRLIAQNAVTLDGTVIESNLLISDIDSGILKVGKRQIIRLTK
ncbi:MAG: tyrosine--tRNA ligase [Dehalococcoidia bacterium]|nr:tyrosine--tRNA ligase [Dehalococcoidia bacterium]MQG15550.1 tyrosine--tRNA ligase [SAR202 cluster bacterium]|tara:strand:+ start:21277 stop:22479 length:1203 start_codon:yes stop_codon:yes gene_type:complete